MTSVDTVDLVVFRPEERAMDVHILSWPRDVHVLERLRGSASPRLVLVPPGESAPVLHDDLEDWIRIPVDALELALRCRRLARLAGTNAPMQRQVVS